jgi:hypothetical protein
MGDGARILTSDKFKVIFVLTCAIVIVNHISDVADNKFAKSAAVLMLNSKSYSGIAFLPVREKGEQVEFYVPFQWKSIWTPQ